VFDWAWAQAYEEAGLRYYPKLLSAVPFTPVPGSPPNAGELSRLYLKKGVQGGGLGARLLETTLDFLRDRFERVFLSVYAENFGAQRFYQRYGFGKIADITFQVGDHFDPEYLYELKL